MHITGCELAGSRSSCAPAPGGHQRPFFEGFWDSAEPAAVLAALLDDELRNTLLAAFAAPVLVTLDLGIRYHLLPCRVACQRARKSDVLRERESPRGSPRAPSARPARAGRSFVSRADALDEPIVAANHYMRDATRSGDTIIARLLRGLMATGAQLRAIFIAEGSGVSPRW